MNARARCLLGKNARLGRQHLLPAGFRGIASAGLGGQLQEHLVVPQLRGAQAAVEARDLRIPGYIGKNGEAFAGARLDQRRDEQPEKT